MTEFDLKSTVSEFYNGALTTDKALKLFELEFGYKPDIEKNTYDVSINIDVLTYEDATDAVTVANLLFMKQLQESGKCNMFMSGIEVQKHLLLSRKGSKELVMFYMNHYDAIYFPENLL